MCSHVEVSFCAYLRMKKKQPKGDFFKLSNDPPSIHTPVGAHGVNSMWAFSTVLSGRVLHSCGAIKLCKKTSSKWSTYLILLLLPSKWQTICLETQDPGEQTKAILCLQEAEQPYLKHCKKSLLQTVLQKGKTDKQLLPISCFDINIWETN